MRSEIFKSAVRADALALTIVDAAHTGVEGDDIVAIPPVERVIRIARALLRPTPSYDQDSWRCGLRALDSGHCRPGRHGAYCT